MQTAPLYPNAWNVWRIAVSGPPKSDPGSQMLHLDTLSRVQKWLIHWLGDVGTLLDTQDAVRLKDAAPSGHAVRRREELDTIPRLPAGETHEVTAVFFYTGEQESITWPADDKAMLLAVYPPDTTTAAPETLPGKVGDLAAKGLSKVQTLGIVVGVTALLIAAAIAVASRRTPPPPRRLVEANE